MTTKAAADGTTTCDAYGGGGCCPKCLGFGTDLVATCGACKGDGHRADCSASAEPDSRPSLETQLTAGRFGRRVIPRVG